VIRLHLSAQALAATRFAVSPLMQAGTALYRLAEADWRADPVANAVHDVLLQRRLYLLESLMVGAARSYVPDLVNPQPASYDPELDAELHQVATTPTDRVTKEIDVMVNGRSRAGLVGRTIPRPVNEVLQRRGEDGFVQRLPDELKQFWRHYLRDRWPAVARSLEGDINHRAQIAARSGLGSVLGSLSSAGVWDGHILQTAGPYTVEVDWEQELLLIPSAGARRFLIVVDPCGQRTTYVIYPVQCEQAAEISGRRSPVGNLVGHTRWELMASLGIPRTTTELARRHHLSVSTVSYHLARLQCAGMLSRVRQGNKVYYQLVDSGT
jgi:Helix-turn-helix domain